MQTSMQPASAIQTLHITRPVPEMPPHEAPEPEMPAHRPPEPEIPTQPVPPEMPS